jgi:DNA-directed RNA polymerase specialized sigma24 family protein
MSGLLVTDVTATFGGIKSFRSSSNTYVDTERVARHLGISAASVKQLRAKSQLPYYRFGGSIRYRLEEVETWAHGMQSATDYGARGGGHTPDEVTELRTARRALREAEELLAKRSSEFRKTVRSAAACGLSDQQIGSAVGLSRQRVYQIRLGRTR